MRLEVGPASRHPWLEALHQCVCRLLAQVFYRRIEVVGLDRIPRGVPLVFVANHPNMLIDPLLLVAVLPVPVQFLATIILWKHWAARPWLWLGDAIPIARVQDARPLRGQVLPSRHNRATFERCYAALARDGCIGIFPEGISRNEPHLQRIRSGAARLALGAERRHGPLGVLIVPVGLNFEARDRFLSRVLVQIGEPLDPRPELEMQSKRQRGALASLTRRVEQALEDVTLTYEDWEAARLFERAAQVVSRPEATLSGTLDLDLVFANSKQLAEVHEWMARAAPEQLAATIRAVRQYDALLEDHGLPEEAAALARHPLPLAGRLLRVAALLLLRLPFAALGTLLNCVPYKLTDWLSRATTNERQSLATHKVVVGTLLFPTAWLVTGAVAASRFGVLIGLAVALLAPLSGLLALPFVIGRERLVRRVRAYLVLSRQAGLGQRLRELRAQIVTEIRRAIALHAERPASGAPLDPLPAALQGRPRSRTPPDLWILRTVALRRVPAPPAVPPAVVVGRNPPPG